MCIKNSPTNKSGYGARNILHVLRKSDSMYFGVDLYAYPFFLQVSMIPSLGLYSIYRYYKILSMITFYDYVRLVFTTYTLEAK